MARVQSKNSRREPNTVDNIADIPTEATPLEVFRLAVEIRKVHERTTKTGDPCYFLDCRDTKGISFSVVLWETQFIPLQTELEEGEFVTLDVRVPRAGFTAFTLA